MKRGYYNPKTRRTKSAALIEAFNMLIDRGINPVWISHYCSISGRTTESHIMCALNQIVEKDDIPENCEVVYAAYYDGNHIERYSYEDPILCDAFYAMIFEKRHRKTTKLRAARRRM